MIRDEPGERVNYTGVIPAEPRDSGRLEPAEVALALHAITVL
jgi:hypothetical protein